MVAIWRGRKGKGSPFRLKEMNKFMVEQWPVPLEGGEEVNQSQRFEGEKGHLFAELREQ